MGKESEYTFFLRRLEHGQQTHEKMLNITNHQGNRNTSMSRHQTSVRMAITKKTRNNKCWQGCGEKRTLMNYWWECKLL